MPFYEYACDECRVTFDVRKPMSRSDTAEKCPQCEGGTRKVITGCGVIFKGDDWSSKNNRVKGQMADRRRKAGIRQEEKVRDGGIPGGKLVPNVSGERVGSWEEAGKLAKSKGKSTEGYAKMAAKEKSKTKKLPTG